MPSTVALVAVVPERGTGPARPGPGRARAAVAHGRAELHPVPDRLDVRHQRLDAGRVGRHLELALGDPLGEGVHDLAEVGRLVRAGDAAGLAGEEPLRRAGRDAVEEAGGDRHRLVRRAQRLDRPGGRAGPPPGRRVGHRRQRAGRRRSRRPAGRAAGRPPASAPGWSSGSAAVRRSSLTRPPSDSVRAGRPSTFSTLTPSSSRNRDGWSPSSSGDAHGGDDEALAGAGARDVEQPALLDEQLARRWSAAPARRCRSGRRRAASSGGGGRASRPAGRARRRRAATRGPWPGAR